MIKRAILSLFILVLFAGVISAININTPIKIKTLPEHVVEVVVHDPNPSAFLLYERFKNVSDKYGDISFVFSSEKQNFNLMIFVKKDGVKIISEKYAESYPAGKPIYIELAPSWFQLIETPSQINETNSSESITNATNTIINETEIDDKGIGEESDGGFMTGLTIFGENGFLLKNKIYFYYSAGIIVFLAVVFIIVRFIISRRAEGGSREIKVRKLSDLIHGKPEEKEDSNDVVESIERKMAEIQNDFQKIKKEMKIKELKRRIIESEKELDKLKKR